MDTGNEGRRGENGERGEEKWRDAREGVERRREIGGGGIGSGKGLRRKGKRREAT